MPVNWPTVIIHAIGNVRGIDSPLDAAAAEKIVVATIALYPNAAIEIEMDALAKGINVAFSVCRLFKQFAPNEAKIAKLDKVSATLSRLERRLTAEVENAPLELLDRFNGTRPAVDSEKNVPAALPSTALATEMHRMSEVAKELSPDFPDECGFPFTGAPNLA